MNVDRQEIALLVLLNLSAAFDTLDHRIMGHILDNDFGRTSAALSWLTSFLSFQVNVSLLTSCNLETFLIHVVSVPWGSCLGPILVSMYASRLF